MKRIDPSAERHARHAAPRDRRPAENDTLSGRFAPAATL